MGCVSWGSVFLKAILQPGTFDAPRVAAGLIHMLIPTTFHWFAPGAASRKRSGQRLTCRFLWQKTGTAYDRRVRIPR